MRYMWSMFEPIHDVTYFSAGARTAFENAGLRGFWRGYFAGRAAPLGPVGSGPVYALFYGFARHMVDRALPAVWELADPGDYTLLARAYSSGGKMQPMEHEPLNGGYMIHHSRPRAVHAEPGRVTTARCSDAESLVYDMNAFAEENMRRPLDVELEFDVGAGI